MSEHTMHDPTHSPGDLNDMLEEHHILLPTSQLLTGFLTTVPFTDRFTELVMVEKYIFFAAYLFSMASVIVLSSVAVQHRLLRPLRDREAFKRRAGRQILLGAGALTCALTLVTQVVVSEIVGEPFGYAAAAITLVLAGLFWVVAPLLWKRKRAV